MQTKKSIWDNRELIETLEKGGVVVMPTDTIYGVVGKAENSAVVDQIYFLRKRNLNKPCIILVGDIGELERFSVILSEEQKNIIKNFSISTSFILDCPDEKFTYLHRGTKSLAFRIPKQDDLINLLLQTGPLIAPSANPEALPPAQNINEAKKYFGDLVDLYVDGGDITGQPSKIIKLNKDGIVIVLRG